MRISGEPLPGAVILFDGTTKTMTDWHHRDGSPATWPVSEGVLTVGRGDIFSNEVFRDAYIHLEFRVPDMPHAKGQAKGNSGVYVQGRYEIQVLDSYGVNVPGKGDCGAVYDQFAPLVNACLPPMEWQTYDIIFRAARVGEWGEVVEPARLTVLQNGIVIHNNVAVKGPTGGAMDHDVGAPGPLRLQDHGNPVQYRNIWIVHLPLEGSPYYDPR